MKVAVHSRWFFVEPFHLTGSSCICKNSFSNWFYVAWRARTQTLQQMIVGCQLPLCQGWQKSPKWVRIPCFFWLAEIPKVSAIWSSLFTNTTSALFHCFLLHLWGSASKSSREAHFSSPLQAIKALVFGSARDKWNTLSGTMSWLTGSLVSSQSAERHSRVVGGLGSGSVVVTGLTAQAVACPCR